jgi:hypothetical protein
MEKHGRPDIDTKFTADDIPGGITCLEFMLVRTTENTHAGDDYCLFIQSLPGKEYAR